jgi:WD40 repeat protein
VHGDLLCVGAGDGLLASASVDGTLRLWDLRNLGERAGHVRRQLDEARPHVLDAHEGRVTGLALLHANAPPDTSIGVEECGAQEHLIVTCGHDGFVRSWWARCSEGVCKLDLEGEVDVVAAMGLHAMADERLLCLAASPVDAKANAVSVSAAASARYV